MDCQYIEDLVLEAKQENIKAKETIANEFTPLILKLSKKSYINSYDFEDIKNECYKTLFKCLNLYKPDEHRFVAYATNAIKNSVNHLIRVSVRRNDAEGPGAYILDGKLDNMIYSPIESIEDIVLKQVDKGKLKVAMKYLNAKEQELIAYIYFKGYSLKKYSELKGITYYEAASSKTRILDKLKAYLNSNVKKGYLN
jgi:RNA polymerase sigma factor (sigma-70 family)